jgi:hypothetical protein
MNQLIRYLVSSTIILYSVGFDYCGELCGDGDNVDESSAAGQLLDVTMTTVLFFNLVIYFNDDERGIDFYLWEQQVNAEVSRRVRVVVCCVCVRLLGKMAVLCRASFERGSGRG